MSKSLTPPPPLLRRIFRPHRPKSPLPQVTSRLTRLLILHRYAALKSLTLNPSPPLTLIFTDPLLDAVLTNLKLNPHASLHFFNLALQHYNPYTRPYCRIIHTLANARLFDEARSFLNDLVRMPTPRGEVGFVYHEVESVFKEYRFSGAVFDMLLKAYAKEGMVREALYVFVEMQKYGRRPSLLSCNSLLSGMVRAGDFGGVGCVYEQMTRAGVVPDVYMCSIVVNAYCKDGRVGKAVEFVRGMERMGVECNVVIYNCLINGYIEKADVREVRGVLEMMEEKGVSKNVVTYSLPVKGYCRTGGDEGGGASV